MTWYYLEMKNGKRGYGTDSYKALVDAIGKNKADIVCEYLHSDTGRNFQMKYPIYAKNGNLIAEIEVL